MHKLMLPRLGQTMEEALLVAWVVPLGQEFDVGEVLYEVETEKVTTGVQATLPGRLVRLLAAEEDLVQVGQVLAVIADPGESPSDADIEKFLSGMAGIVDDASGETVPETAPEQVSAPLPPAASETRDASETSVGSDTVRAMPRIRALAQSLGVDLSQFASISGGLVTEAQVREAAAQQAPAPTGSVAISAKEVAPPLQVQESQASANIRIRERRRLTPVARRMAEVVARSWSQVPQFSQSVQVDCSRWRDRRNDLRLELGLDIGYTELILAALVKAVHDVPEVNGSFDGDALVLYSDINVSLAVDTPSGLQVPVLHSLQDFTLAGISRALRQQATKARADELTRDDVRGGTITMSNLGMYGIEGGAPVVTAPQSCIVFIGAMTERVVVIDGGVGVRPMCTVVNSFDHRAVDGATAAKFTVALRRHLEEI